MDIVSMRRLLASVLTLLLVAAGLPAAAQVLGDAKVPFSADRVLTVDGRTFEGRLYATPGRQRHEQMLEGMQQVVLLRADRGEGWLVLPGLHSYVEFRFPQAIAELSDPSLRGTPVGQEKIAGLQTTKYRVEHAARDGTSVDGWMWVTRDGIVMKLDGVATPRRGKPTPFSMQLSNVRIGPQDTAMFDLPQGFMKLPSNALQPLLGGVAGQRG
jgi:hypothetical protein